MDKKEATLQEKAKTISGYKYFVEMKKGLTRSTYDHVLSDIYLLSIIGENKDWSNLFIPKGTRLICKKIPDSFKPNGIIYIDPASFLELGKTYTIEKSVVGTWFSWYELKGLSSECRVRLSWFEIAAEDRPTPQQALELYIGNIDEEYEHVTEYLDWEDKRQREKEANEPVEIFIYNGLGFDYFELDNFDEDYKGGDYAHIDLCEECSKKYNLPENLISKEPFNGLPYSIDCSGENYYEKAVYGYAIPLKDGEIILEKKR